MTTLGLILLVLAAAYAALIGSFAVGLRRVIRAGRQRSARSASAPPRVSVIVPARDEEAHIEACVRSLLAQDYPADRFEVIIVDDLSTDATPHIVRRIQAEAHVRALVPAGDFPEADDPDPAPSLRLIQTPENEDRKRAHKKRAIEKAIGEADGAIILTTDADCVVPPGWLRAMTTPFADADVALVSGPVGFHRSRSPLLQVQALEFLGLIAMGAGAIGIGRPNLCNGANIAYRKDVFRALGGFSGIDHLTSGDDELLMQRIAYETDWSVTFCPSPDALVVTEPVRSAQAFFEQRRRWASKGAHYQAGPVRVLVAVIALFFLGLGAASVAWPFVQGLGAFVAGAWALKLTAEAAVVVQGALMLRRTELLPYLPLAELFHVPYIIGMGIAGALGGYTWKGRRVAR